MGVLDKFISAVSPQWALRRERSAQALSILKERSYDAASGGFRGINSRNKGPNSDQRCVNITRANARELIRNKSVRRCRTVLTNAIIGTGIIARPKVQGSEAQQLQVTEAHARWVKNCDAEGLHDWYGLQRLRMDTTIGDGEVFSRYLTPTRVQGMTPLEIQVFDADMLDETQRREGEINGITFAANRRKSYRLYKQHPDSPSATREAVDVAAKEIGHLFFQDRPGQVRGVSWLAPIAIRVKDLDESIDANLMLQKIAACYSLAVEQNNGAAGSALGIAPPASYEKAESVNPGQVLYLNNGEKVVFGQPPSVSSFAAFAKDIRQEIATGMNVPYADASGDVSGANFSSLRAARITFKRFVEQMQWTVVIPMMIERDCLEWERAAKLAGVIPANTVIKWEYTPQPLESVDPATDVTADIMLTRAMGLTPQQFIARRGEDFTEQLAQYKKAFEQMAAAGVVASIDPRETYSSDTFTSGGVKDPQDTTGVAA